MKGKIILTAFLGMIVFAGLSNGQVSGRVTSVTIDNLDPLGSGDHESVVISYTGLDSRKPRFYEAIIPAATPAECVSSRDYSNVVRLGADRASSTYDAATNTHTVRWVRERELTDSCRVLVVRTGVNWNDLNIVRGNYGSSASGSIDEPEILSFSWAVGRGT